MIKLFFMLVYGGLLFIIGGVFFILIINDKAPVGYYFGLAFVLMLIYLLFKPRHSGPSLRQIKRNAKARKKLIRLSHDR